jgi:hypothetical protein
MTLLDRSFAAALAAFALAALPASAQGLQQTPGSRITITQCNPHRHRVSGAHPWIDPYGVYHGPENFPYTEGFLAVTYTNDAPKAAKEIDFGLVARGSLIAVTKDVGTFTNGATIAHEFSVDPEIFPVGTAFPYCAVLRVQYADGSIWNNPNPPAP